MGEYDFQTAGNTFTNNNPTFGLNNMIAANGVGATNVANQLTNSLNNQAANANASIALLGSIGPAQKPGTYSPGSGLSSFSGTKLSPTSNAPGSVFETGASQSPYLYSQSLYGANNGEGIGQGTGMAPGYGGFNNPAVPTSPQQWYDNGGYDPYNPNTYAPSAQRNLGTGFGGMGSVPTGAGNAGNEPGGFSSYPKGEQSSVPFTWDNYFGQAQAPAKGGQGGGWEAEYLLANPDVMAEALKSGQNVNAFADHHFQTYGKDENRSIFDAAQYLRENPDVAAAGANPFQHYLDYGKNEGRAAPMSGVFDAANYLAHNQDVAAAGVDPLAHFLKYGQNEGREGAFAMMPEPYSGPTDISAQSRAQPSLEPWTSSVPSNVNSQELYDAVHSASALNKMDPGAYAALIYQESSWNPSMGEQGGNYGMGQIAPNEFQLGDNGKLGGLTRDQYVGASPAQQVAAHADLLNRVLQKAGIDMSQYDARTQYAIAQAINFGPWSQAAWLPQFLAGDTSVPTTSKPQGDLNLSIDGLRNNYDKKAAEFARPGR